MSVYNGERYLNEAIDSVLAQTFTNFEFLIIDDASTDGTTKILHSYQDPRIRIITNMENLGLTKSLNNGLELSKGEYIARMDADDISLAERLEIQVSFMDRNPQICVCGSWVETIGNNIDEIWKYPTNSDEIKCRQLFECSIAHPSAIIKKKYLQDNQLNYDVKFERSQDYDLWVRISTLYNLANINKVLLKHRIHPNAVGISFSNDQKRYADLIRYRQLREFLGLSPTEDEMALHNSISTRNYETSGDYLNHVNEWFLEIWGANQIRRYFNNQALYAELANRWYDICYYATNIGLETWDVFMASRFSYKIKLTNKKKYALLAKCLLKRG